MEVQDVGARGVHRAQLARPGVDLALVLRVVERREHAIRGAGAVLEGRMRRGRSRHTGRAHRIHAAQRRRVVDGMEVDAGVEGARVAQVAAIAARTGDQRDVDALVMQTERERASDER
jgi:hypothetical protein